MRLLEHNILFKFAILILSSVLLIACSDSDRASERSMNQQRAPFTTAGSDIILACAKKENGQLRIVEDHSECHPSENPVSWNVAGPAGPPGAQGSQGQCSNCEPLQYQLVGFSQQGGPGATGVLQLTSYCQASYPASRICTTEEVVKTVTFPAVTSSPSNPGPSAWVAPTAIAGRGSSVGFDITTGHQTNTQGLTCGGWSSTGLTGLTVNDRGQFFVSPCSSSLKVACCAPVNAVETLSLSVLPKQK